ncbi:S-layer homology domain-containing protein [Paenibacillus sp. GYB004]
MRTRLQLAAGPHRTGVFLAAREVLASAMKEGVLAGSAPGELQPSKSITRAEAAAIVHRMLVCAGFISAP